MLLLLMMMMMMLVEIKRCSSSHDVLSLSSGLVHSSSVDRRLITAGPVLQTVAAISYSYDNVQLIIRHRIGMQ